MKKDEMKKDETNDGCIDCLYKTKAFQSAREGGWCYLFRHRPKVIPCKKWVIKFRNYDSF